MFVRERANGSYSTATYFFSKAFFELIPMRALPPLLLGSISYWVRIHTHSHARTSRTRHTPSTPLGSLTLPPPLQLPRHLCLLLRTFGW